jgi:hypothetical protein
MIFQKKNNVPEGMIFDKFKKNTKDADNTAFFEEFP